MTAQPTSRPVPALVLALILGLSTVTAVPWMGPSQPTAAAQTSGTQAPDLVVEDLQITPPQPEPGDPVRIDFNLSNRGGEETGAFSYLIEIDDGASLNATFDHASIHPNETYQVTTWWNATDGNHTLHVAGDVHNEVDEADETNNDQWLQFRVDGATGTAPDLVVSELATKPREPHEGERFDIGVEVTNIGDAPSNGTWAEVHLDGDLVARAYVPALAAGERVWTSGGSTTATEGNHTLSAVVDPADVVAESDEGNNKALQTIHVEPPRQPDLVADHLHVPDGHFAGDDLAIGYGVRNDGGPAGSFDVEVYIDGELVHRDHFPELPGGLGAARFFEWDGEPGDHTARFVVDSGDDVDERDEGNNALERPFELLAPPDPAVTELTVEKTQLRTDAAEGPTNPVAGQSIRATVANLGAGGASWLHLELSVCSKEPAVAFLPGGSCTWAFFELHELEPGQERTFEMGWETWDKAGDYDVCARLVGVHAPQLSEANDERCTDTFVWVGGTGAGGL